MNERDAVAWVAVAAIGADGETTDEDVVELQTALMQLKLYERSDELIDEALTRAVDFANADPDGTPARAAAAIPVARRSAAFILAADLVFAASTGKLGESERAVLAGLQKALGVKEDVGRKVLDVMALKHAV